MKIWFEVWAEQQPHPNATMQSFRYPERRIVNDQYKLPNDWFEIGEDHDQGIQESTGLWYTRYNYRNQWCMDVDSLDELQSLLQDFWTLSYIPEAHPFHDSAQWYMARSEYY